MIYQLELIYSHFHDKSFIKKFVHQVIFVIVLLRWQQNISKNGSFVFFPWVTSLISMKILLLEFMFALSNCASVLCNIAVDCAWSYWVCDILRPKLVTLISNIFCIIISEPMQITMWVGCTNPHVVNFSNMYLFFERRQTINKTNYSFRY